MGATELGMGYDGTNGEAQVKLGGVEVSELTSFAQKKHWIDSKISFLSSLPPISYTSPLPPHISPTSRQELKEWWEEHEAIEEEVERYDMGDLKRLKAMAKEASKRNLSAKDTDLIEITLSTLFALDKLLHLLRQRRRNLKLLKYRLQWEELTSQTWSTHSRILEKDLPGFLSAAKWNGHERMTPLSSLEGSSGESIERRAEGAKPGNEGTSSMPNADDEIAGISQSHSNSSTTLSNTAKPISFATLSLSQTSSATTSQLPPSTLTLSHQTLLTSLTSLTTQLTSSSTSLDRLIDSSPSALPEAFLDEMERLENAVLSLERMGEWAGEVERVWKVVEGVWEGFKGVEERGAELGRRFEVEMKVGWRPTEAVYEGLKGEFESVQTSLESLRKRGRLKRPFHPVVKAQGGSFDVDRLELILRKEEERLILLLETLRLSLSRYSLALQEVANASKLTQELTAVITIFANFLLAEKALEGRVRLNDEFSFVERRREEEEDVIEGAWDELASPVKRHLRSVPLLLRHSSKAIVELGKFRVEGGLGEGLRGLVGGVGREMERVEEGLRGEEERRVKLGRVRSWVEGLRGVEREKGEVRGKLREGMEIARWKEGMPSELLDESAGEINIDLIRTRTNDINPTPLQHLLEKRHSKLFKYLTSLHQNLIDSLGILPSMKVLLEDVRRQTKAVWGVDERLDVFGKEVDGVKEMVKRAMMGRDVREVESIAEVVRRRIEELERSLTEDIIETVHTNIPFLASSSFSDESTDLAPFSLSEQDSVIRTHINSRIAASSGKIDDSKKGLEELRHWREALGWDEERVRVEEELNRVEKGMNGIREVFERQDGERDSASYASLLTEIDSHATALTSHSTSIATLFTPLSLLVSSPISSSTLFSTHSTREADHSRLSERLTALTTSLDKLRTAIEGALQIQHGLEARRAEAEADAREILGLLQAKSETLEGLIREMAALKGRPQLRDESCLIAAPLEADFDKRIQELSVTVRGSTFDAEDLASRANVAASALETSDNLQPLAAELVQELDRLRTVGKAALDGIAAAASDRQLLQEVRSTHSSLRHLDAAISSLTMAIKEEVETTRWRPGCEKTEAAMTDFKPAVQSLCQQHSAIGIGLLATTLSHLLHEHTVLNANLDNLAMSSRAKLDALPGFLQHLTSAHSQRKAVCDLLGDIRELDNNISEVVHEVNVGATKGVQDWTEVTASGAEQRWRHHCVVFDERLAVLRSREQTANRPLDGSAASGELVPDPNNTLSDIVSKQLDAVEDHLFVMHGRLDVLSHHIASLGWDRNLARVERELLLHAEKQGAFASLFSTLTEPRDLPLLEDFAERCDEHAVTIANVTESTRALHTSLSALMAVPQSSGPLFSDHVLRSAALHQLVQRHAQLSDRADDLAKQSRTTVETCRAATEQEEQDRFASLAEEEEKKQTRPAAMEEKRSTEIEEERHREDFETARLAEIERTSELARISEEQDRTSVNGSPKSVRSFSTDDRPQRPPRSLRRAIANEDEAFAYGQATNNSAPSRVAFTSSEDVEDVFGPTLHTVPFPFGDEESDASSAKLAEVKARLDAIDLDRWMDDLSFLPLPSEDDAGYATRQLAWVKTRLDDLALDGKVDHSTTETITTLRDELDLKLQLSARVNSLAQFSSRVEVADGALSDLLSSIDAVTPGLNILERPSTPTSPSTTPISMSLIMATDTITETRRVAIFLIDDGRVEANVTRLEQTLAEMNDMIEDLKPRSASSLSTTRSTPRAPSSVSTHSSQTSDSSLRAPTSQTPSRSPSRQTSSRQSLRSLSSQHSMSRTPSSLSLNATTPRKSIFNSTPNSGSLRTPRARVTSTPLSSKGATLPKAFNFTSRSRAVSQRTPGATQIPEPPNRRDAATPLGERLRSSLSSRAGKSLANSMEERRLSASFGPSTRRDSLASSTSSLRSNFFTPAAPDRLSSVKKKQSPRFSPPVRRVYKANKRRRVDVEVGRIVNQIPLSVHVRAAEQQSHQDESGMYWIGERLYFVRILRSKTAMVRVGGGWQNLATFLLSHFSDTETIQNLKISPTSTRRTTSSSGQEPTWISSATLSASTSSSLASSTRSRHSLGMGVSFSPAVRVAPPASDPNANTMTTPRVKNIWRP